MSGIIKTVSQLIENQFPAVYREEGPQLVAFVKAYFEFLENDEESSTVDSIKCPIELRSLLVITFEIQLEILVVATRTSSRESLLSYWF